MISVIIEPKFQLGEVVVTAGIDRNYMQSPDRALVISKLLQRHANKDDGDLCEEDKEQNTFAHENNQRIFSMYHVGEDTIYIITEWDHSVTTILFYDEY